MISQLVIGAGMLTGLGAYIVVREMRPRFPHPVDTTARLTNSARPLETPSDSRDLSERLGRVVLRHTGTWSFMRVPHRDLNLLRISVSRFLGERALFALVGLVTPPAAVTCVSLVGVTLPITIPVFASLALAIALSFVPYYNVADQARKAEAEFERALTCYLDLVALGRAGGAGPLQALEQAAEVGDSWVFARIRAELGRARYSGTPAWDALRTVGEELRLPALVTTGDVMKLAGEEGAGVYDNLRARVGDLRNELLTRDKTQAGVRSERARAPVALTTMVFLLIMATPMAMSIL